MSYKKKLDETDVEILKILSKDARMSFRKIARILNKSPVTITKHENELIDDGIINLYTAELNYERLGYDIIAFIELTIGKGKMLEAEKDIAVHPNIFAVYDVTGTYDAMLLARFKTRRELDALIKKINSYDYVVRTNTHLILNVMKEHTNFSKLMKVDALKSETEFLINKAHKDFQRLVKIIKNPENFDEKSYEKDEDKAFLKEYRNLINQVLKTGKLEDDELESKIIEINKNLYAKTHKKIKEKLETESNLGDIIIDPLISLMQELLADVLDIRKKDRL
ncbi:MAG: Lrp/AsnC family transcriptional regulator [Promethearchaeota archaeon]